MKRCLLLGRKAMTKLDSILKSRGITLPTKVHLVKVMDFLVVMDTYTYIVGTYIYSHTYYALCVMMCFQIVLILFKVNL